MITKDFFLPILSERAISKKPPMTPAEGDDRYKKRGNGVRNIQLHDPIGDDKIDQGVV
jgi:hypothetical protein